MNKGKKDTLTLFSMGCDQTNHKILLKLYNKKHAVVSEMTKEFKMSRMPFNRRINQMESIGLLKRVSHKRDVIPTELTKSFLEVIDLISTEMNKARQ